MKRAIAAPKELSLHSSLVTDTTFFYLGKLNEHEQAETNEEIAENARLIVASDTSSDTRAAIIQHAFMLMQGWLQAALRTSDEAERTALIEQAERCAREYMFGVFRHTAEGRNALVAALAVQTGREIEFDCSDSPAQRQARTVGRFEPKTQSFICETFE